MSTDTLQALKPPAWPVERMRQGSNGAACAASSSAGDWLLLHLILFS